MSLLHTAVLFILIHLFNCIPVDEPSDIPGQYCYQCYDIDETETCTNVAPCESRCVTECFEENNLITLHHYCEDDAPCESDNGDAKSIGKLSCNGTLCNKDNACTALTSNALTCEVCSGTACAVSPPNKVKCPNDKPYCMTTVKTDAKSGNRTTEKMCASGDSCNTMWWKGTSDKQECLDPSHTFSLLDCAYCCVNPECNLKPFPDMGQMYTGTS